MARRLVTLGRLAIRVTRRPLEKAEEGDLSPEVGVIRGVARGFRLLRLELSGTRFLGWVPLNDAVRLLRWTALRSGKVM